MPPALVLSVLAVLLAGPVPTLLARADALRRVPRSAMALWQAVALAAVLAALGAGLSLVTGSVLRGGPGGGRYVVGVLALLLTATVLARLLLSGHRVGTRVRALRRRHLELLDLLATEDSGVRVLEHEAPMAYCVPGVAVSRAAPRSRVVVSVATKRLLAPEELDAVLAHERAHLRARHDLVLEAFTVLHQAFPALVRSAVALGEVRFLVEVLADRAARRRAGARPLARALVVLVDSRAPEAALAAGGQRDVGLAERVMLLGDHGRHPVLAAATLAAAAAVLVLPTAFVALPWLATLIP
ncbi:MAG: M56 family metallopeptidase [Nocardioidaceae bacterium]